MNYNKLSTKEKINYGLAGLGQNMTITFVNTFLLSMIYLYMGFDAAGLAILTVIITIAKVWDAVNDPIMGVLIDKAHFKAGGKLRPFILISAVPVAVLSVLLFAIPANWSQAAKLAMFGVCYLLWDAAYTICDVPFWGLSGALTSDSDERTKLISFARTFGNIGMGVITLLGVMLAGWFSKGEETTKQGWVIAAIVVTVVGMSLFTLAYFGTKERTRNTQKDASLKEIFGALKVNKPLFIILLGSVLGFGRTLIQVSGTTVAAISFGDEGKFTYMGASVLVSMILATVICPFVLKKASKKNLMIYSSLFACVVYLVMFFIPLQSFVWVLVTIFFTGFSLGFFMVIQTSMIADSVDYAEVLTGERNEGVCFSALTFSGKLMNALSTLAFMLVMLVVHYEEGAAITSTIQKGAYFAITIVPAISCLIGVIPFFFYPLSEATVRENSAILAQADAARMLESGAVQAENLEERTCEERASEERASEETVLDEIEGGGQQPDGDGDN